MSHAPQPATGSGLTLAELAEALGGAVEGDPSVRVTVASGLEDAGPESLVRVEGERYLTAAEACPAAALLTDRKLGPLSKPAVRVDRVRLAFARCIELLAPPEPRPVGVHSTAILGEDVELGEGCAIGPYAVLGAGVRVGARTVIHSHCVLMDGTQVGEDCMLYPQVVLYPRTLIGNRVRLHAGVVLGADGYGYEWDGERHAKIPQVGRTRVDDDVEIGANSSVDKATTDETVVGAGTKIDNIVQVGHNVRMGRHCLIMSGTGIAGSVKMGERVVITGQGGVKDHCVLGDGSMVVGGAAVWTDVGPKEIVSGRPARPHREMLRAQAAMLRLPRLLRRVAELEKRLGIESDTSAEE